MRRYRPVLFATLFWIGCSSGGDLITPSGDLPLPSPQGPPPRTTTNRLPVAVADTYRVQPGDTLVIVPPGFLVNDRDQDGDRLVAFPADLIRDVIFNQATGHFEYRHPISTWQDIRSRGVAYDWRPSGGLTFHAFPNATAGVEGFLYRVYEDKLGGLLSEPATIVIVVE